MVLAKPMPIANVNRIVFVIKQSVSQFGITSQPIANWSCFAVILWHRVPSPPNRIALGDWQAVNLFNFDNLPLPKYHTIRQPITEITALSVNLCKSGISRPNWNVWNLYVGIMKEYVPNRNRLVGSAKLVDGLLNYKHNPIHIGNRPGFCQYHLTF